MISLSLSVTIYIYYLAYKLVLSQLSNIKREMSKNIKSHLLPNTEEYYEVEEIINKKLTSNGMMYLIKWKGYPSEKDFTWEPIQHLTEVEGLVKEFNLRFEQTPPPKEQKKDEPIKLSARLA